MTDYSSWKTRVSRAHKTVVLVLFLGVALGIWGSRGSVAVTPEESAPSAAAPAQGKSDGNRIAGGLQNKLEGLGASAVLKVVVTMAKGKGVAQAQAAAGSFSVHRQFTIINGFTATMTRAQIEALSQSPNVVSIYDNFVVKANRADAMQAYGVTNVHSNALAELTSSYDGSGVGICVVDTGIYAAHAEFNGGAKVQGFCNAMNGGCFPGDPGVPAVDGNGHGTHVASIAAGNNGVAPGALLWGAKVLDDSGSGTVETFVAGIEWCAAQPGVHVINGSLSAVGKWDGSDPMSQAADAAAATKVAVFAAGNTGPGQIQIGAPGAASEPITVGATADWLSPVGPWRKGLAVFSSRGPTTDNRIKPDIVAPGVDIEAAWNDGGTKVASGTSMASPFVAGVAALMLDANMGLLTAPEGASAAVKAILAQTAETRGDSSLIVDGYPKNYDTGWGEIDAYAAVAEAEGAAAYTPTPFPVELYANPTIADNDPPWEFEFEVTDPNTKISAVVTNGGVWDSLFLLGMWWRNSMGQDFDAQLHAPAGTPGGTLVDESTCEVDADTQCGVEGRQETLVADPADFPGGVLPLGTWRVVVEPWSDTDGLAEEIIDLTVLLGPVGGGAPPPGNVAPVADAQGMSTDEDTAKAITLTASDSDGGPGPLTYSVVAQPANGSLLGTAPNVTYTPNADFNGSDSFTFKANDGAADSNIATVSITVNPVNDAPVADAQSVSTAENTAAAITLTASDPDGAVPLTYSIVTGPASGSLSGTAPNVTYTPNADYNGPDSFTFKANDGALDSNTATVSITVSPVNDAPVADAQSVSTNEDTAKAVTLTASDPDGGPGPLTYSIVTGPANGSLSGTAPNVTYTPNADFNGSDSFTFKANDGALDSNTAVVSITVNPVNDAPVADSQSVGTNEDTAAAITLTASDIDSAPSELTFIVVAAPANGSLLGTAPNLTYTPNADFSGSDGFTFQANDGSLTSNIATVSITVNAVNDAPVADAGPTPVDLDINASPSVTLNGTAFDPDGDQMTYLWEIITKPKGKLQAQLSGADTLSPEFTPGKTGLYTLRLSVTDANNASSSDTVDVNVTDSGGDSGGGGGGGGNGGGKPCNPKKDVCS